MNDLLLLLLIGFIAGFIGAGVGNAGGTLMVAGLWGFGIYSNIKTAIGTVLLSLLFPVSIGAIRSYWKAGEVKWKVGLILMVANTIGGLIGGETFAKYVSKKNLEYFFACFSIIIGIYFFWKAKYGKYAAGALEG